VPSTPRTEYANLLRDAQIPARIEALSPATPPGGEIALPLPDTERLGTDADLLGDFPDRIEAFPIDLAHVGTLVLCRAVEETF
jgi:hypothetical protein